MNASSVSSILVAALAGAGGAAAFQAWQSWSTAEQAPAAATTGAEALSAGQTAYLVTDVARLNSLVPSQAHNEIDVAHHWASLWFAAEQKNWLLARFFFDETRHHVQRTIAIKQVRDLPDGGTVDLGGIFDAVDPSSFAAVQLAIEDEDPEAFVTAYKKALEGCYLCHKAAGKPYLRPMVPTSPPSTLINFAPDATWPQ